MAASAATKNTFAGKTNSGAPYIELEQLDDPDTQYKKFRQRAKQGWELVAAHVDPDGTVLVIGRTFAAKEQAGVNREALKAHRQKNKGKGKKPGSKKKTTAKRK